MVFDILRRGSAHHLDRRSALLCAALCLAVGSPARAQAGIHVLRRHPTYGLYNAATDGATIVWPAGTYQIGPESAGDDCAFILTPGGTDGRHSRTNLTIDANGVTIVITDPTIGLFQLDSCHGVTIKGLTVDYDPLPYAQAVVTSVDLTNETLDVTMQPGYPAFDHPGFVYGATGHINGGFPWDPTTRLAKEGIDSGHMRLDGYTSLGGGSYRLDVSTGNKYIKALSKTTPGDLYTYLMRRPNGSIFVISNCNPTSINPTCVTVEDVTAYAANMLFMSLTTSPAEGDTGQARVTDCTYTRPTPDDGRIVTTGGGGMLVGGCRQGPYVRDCIFEYGVDDVLNIRTLGRLFKEYPYPGNNSVIRLGPGEVLYPGDTLQLLDPVTGAIGETTIAAVGPPTAGTQDVFLMQPLPGLTGDGVDPSTSIHAYNLNAAGSGFDVQECTFRGENGGIVLTSHGGVFSNNTIEDQAGPGLIVSNPYITAFQRGPVPKDIEIRDNTIRHCGYREGSGDPYFGSSIVITGLKYGFPRIPADVPTVEDILLEGNTIEDWNLNGIFVQSAKDLDVGTPASGQTFAGAVGADDRAIKLLAPGSLNFVNGVDATQASGLDYALTVQSGSGAMVPLASIQVTPPTQKVESIP